MKKVFMVLSLVLLVLVITSVHSLAQQNVIYGCVDKKSGRLRIVDNPSKCRPNRETPIFLASRSPLLMYSLNVRMLMFNLSLRALRL